MEALDYAALGSFVVLALAWVVLPLRAPAAVITPAVAIEPVAVAA
jgi:hypothetical protein